MNSEKESQEKQMVELSFEGEPSLDDFIKELEEKEKDLHISSDLIVEIEESDISEADPFELLSFLDSCQATNGNNGSSAPKPIVTDYQPFNENVSKLENEVVKLREQVSKVETERSEANELARRRQSDFENYRKRMDRERNEMFRNLLSNVATEILPVIDNLNRALESASGLPGKSKDFQLFVDGIGLVNQQLSEVLEEMGIKPIISIGEPFDPHLHEAVAAERTSEFPPHTVIAELLRGYRLDEKIIRHSLVKVSTATNSETPLGNPETK
jgi:molecular chaperone GrpE